MQRHKNMTHTVLRPSSKICYDDVVKYCIVRWCVSMLLLSPLSNKIYKLFCSSFCNLLFIENVTFVILLTYWAFFAILNSFSFYGHWTLWPLFLDFLRGGRRTLTSGVQRSTEVMPPNNPRLTKQGSKDSNDGSVSSEGSKWVIRFTIEWSKTFLKYVAFMNSVIYATLAQNFVSSFHLVFNP